jgi:hypothetical protein
MSFLWLLIGGAVLFPLACVVLVGLVLMAILALGCFVVTCYEYVVHGLQWPAQPHGKQTRQLRSRTIVYYVKS